MAQVTRRQFNTTEAPNVVGEIIMNFLRDAKGLYVEGVEIENGFFVQAKGESTIKKIAGMDLATQVQILRNDSGIIVEIGQGKWSDKIGAGVAGFVLFAPLAVTAAIGAWRQSQLPEEILNHVQAKIMGVSTNSFGFTSPNSNYVQQNQTASAQAAACDPTTKNIEAIKGYKELFDMGILTEEEFNNKKKEILGL